ncbi:MAG TPA: DUF455 domain-containing protein, partial [Ramlibacter sp.]|nr:DUF455 domain-containing protein [Ramlibacter sp.]
MELRQGALQALCTPEPRAKAALAAALFKQSQDLTLAAAAPVPTGPLPGRPPLPRLVHPARVPRRSPASP